MFSINKSKILAHVTEVMLNQKLSFVEYYKTKRIFKYRKSTNKNNQKINHKIIL